MIQFACDQCGKTFSVPDNLAGKTGSCKQCGAKFRVPAAPVEEAFPVIDVLPPRPQPMPTPTPTQVYTPPINVSLPYPPVGKTTSGLGVAAVVLGILALLSCWIPLVNVLAFLMALVGGVLGLVGAIVAVSGKRSGAGWPVAGVLVNGLAAVGVVVFNLIFAAALGGGSKVMVDAVTEARKAAELARIKAGEPGELDAQGENGVWLWLGDKAGYPEMEAAIVRSNGSGPSPGEDIFRLANAGKARIVANLTKIKVLDLKPRIVRVEVVDGEDIGKSGWVAHESVRVAQARKAPKTKAQREAEEPGIGDIGRFVIIEPAVGTTVKLWRTIDRLDADYMGVADIHSSAKLEGIHNHQAQLKIMSGELAGSSGWLDRSDVMVPRDPTP